MPYRHLLNFWPLVPAVDLQEISRISSSAADESNRLKKLDEPFYFFKKNCNKASGDINKDFNCLLVGDTIGCLTKTLARIDRHESGNVNIYLAGTFTETLTRSLLLLSIVENPTTKFNLLERAEAFLEIFGNTHIRPSTATYVEKTSAEFVFKIGIQSIDAPISSFVYLDNLKQCEIDELVNVFNFLKDKKQSYDVGKAWENALRFYFGQRYDSRKNLFDYHFNMKLGDYRIINLRRYLDWCETGVAFKFRKSKYNHSNKTMYIPLRSSCRKGDTTDCYVGDIATSPYLAFGVESGNPELFKKYNNEYISNSEDVSKYNVLDMLEEFSAFSKQKSCNKSAKVHLMYFDTLCKTHRLENFFDAIYIPCDMMHLSNLLLPRFLKEGGVVVFETIKNVVNSTKEQKMMHSKSIDRIAQASGLQAKELGEVTDAENYKIFKHVK